MTLLTTIRNLFFTPKLHREPHSITTEKMSIYNSVAIHPNEPVVKMFTHPAGSHDPLSNTPKTIVHTNLSHSSKIIDKHFELHALRFYIWEDTPPDTSPKDIEAISKGWFRFYIGAKERLIVNNFMIMTEEDLKKMDPCCPDCKDASARNVITVMCGAPDRRGIYVLAEPIDIVPGQTFSAELLKIENLSKPVWVRLHFDGVMKTISTPAD